MHLYSYSAEKPLLFVMLLFYSNEKFMGISQLTCVLYSNYCNGMNENLPKHCIVFLGNIFLHWTKNLNSKTLVIYRAVRYDDIYRMDEINSLSFHIMFYCLFRGVAKYIVYGNTFSSFEWLRSLHAAHHGAWRGDRSRMRTTSQDKTRSSFLTEGLHL